MRLTKRATKAILFTLLLLAVYLGSYPLLWARREGVIFAMTVDRGCIRKTCTEPALRSEWMERGPLRGALTALYRPVNAVLYSDARWK